MTAAPLLDYLDRYPSRPGHKGGETSRAAAVAIAPRAPSLRARVMDLLKAHPGGLTADECAERLGVTVLACRPRLSELHNSGFIKDTGHTRPNASGVRAAVWVVG